MVKIAIILTNTKKLGDTGKSTGFHLAELTHVLDELDKNKIDYEFFSIKGGEAPMDAVDRDDEINNKYLEDKEFIDNVKNTKKVSELSSHNFDGVYFPGGHGTMWDLPHDNDLQQFVRKLHEQHKVIAAVCHGIVGIVEVKLNSVDYLVAGRRINCFTNEEEKKVELNDVVPFLLQTRLEELEAAFEFSEPFEEHVAIDNNLVTGQNPASVDAVARELVKKLQ